MGEGSLLTSDRYDSDWIRVSLAENSTDTIYLHGEVEVDILGKDLAVLAYIRIRHIFDLLELRNSNTSLVRKVKPQLVLVY
jgi:hypothetical protein